MATGSTDSASTRPQRIVPAPVPPLPVVDGMKPDQASTEYSHFRTQLSSHRTGLSEHRTDLSEYRTDLSGERTEMSMRRTGMSFQRTRLSAERTLMSVLRTSLSLISFGFTIYQVFQKLADKDVLSGSASARNFGLALILIGMAMLVIGAVFHVQFMSGLRAERNAMKREGLIHGESVYPPSMTLFAVALVLLLGVVAIVNIVYGVGPFG